MQLRVLRRSTWNWLPVFLSVAETGSVSEASRELGITPAAVSRTLRLLEDHLGRPLFTRAGRSLRLNAAGLQMRGSIRAAVDEVDVGLMAFRPEPFNGVVRVAANGALNDHFVLPSLLELRREHPAFKPDQQIVADRDIGKALSLGEVDLAFGDQPVDGEGIECEAIGSYTIGVYCGRSHALYGREGLNHQALGRQLFCAPSSSDLLTSPDGWPRAWSRQVAIRVTLLSSAVRVACDGELLAVLPDVAVVNERARGDLHRLSLPQLPAREVYCTTSGLDAQRPATQAIRTRVRERLLAAHDRVTGAFPILASK